MAGIGELVVKIRADGDKFKRSLEGAKKSAMSLKSVGQKVSKALKIGFVGLTAAVVGVSFAVRKLQKDISFMVNQSKLVGTSAEEYQKMAFMVQRAGVDVDRFTMALPKMSMRIAQATQGAGPAAAAFKEFGINAKELVNLSPEKQFEALAAAIGKIPNRGDQLRATWGAFDNESIQLLNLFSMNLGKLGKEFDDLRLKITDSQAEAVRQFELSQKKLGMIWQGFSRKVLAHVSPAFTKILDDVSDVIIKMGGVDTAAQGFAKAIITATKFAVTGMRLLASSIDQIILGMMKVELLAAKAKASARPALNQLAMVGRAAANFTVDPRVIGTPQDIPQGQEANILALTASIKAVEQLIKEQEKTGLFARMEKSLNEAFKNVGKASEESSKATNKATKATKTFAEGAKKAAEELESLGKTEFERILGTDRSGKQIQEAQDQKFDNIARGLIQNFQEGIIGTPQGFSRVLNELRDIMDRSSRMGVNTANMSAVIDRLNDKAIEVKNKRSEILITLAPSGQFTAEAIAKSPEIDVAMEIKMAKSATRLRRR